MSWLKKFANLDKIFAWSFLGFIIAVPLGMLTIYNEFFKVHDPQMVIEIMSDTNVLDLRENLPELKIIYGDVDIKNVGKDLSVIVFRVKNIGGAQILPSHYDANSPLAVNLTSGEFLKFEKIGATSDYLSSLATATKASATSIRMPIVIMEPGESYTFKALVLHAARIRTTLKTSGKIAGMREIPVKKIEPDIDTESLYSKALSGSIWVQITRILVYFLALITLVAGTIIPALIISELREKKGRKLNVSRFRKFHTEAISDKQEILIKSYLDDGIMHLKPVMYFLDEPEKLSSILKSYAKAEETGEAMSETDFINASPLIEDSIRSEVFLQKSKLIELIHNTSLATLDENEAIQVDFRLKKFLNDFVQYINIKEN